MAFCPRSTDGFATPAALILSLAIAIVCTAAIARGLFILRLSKAELARTAATFALDGAAVSAETVIIRHGATGRFRWSFTTAEGATEVLAEPEVDKMTLTAAAASDAVLQGLGVGDVEALRARLAAAGAAGGAPQIGDLDAAHLWAECAPSAFSGLGQADRLTLQTPGDPSEVAPQPNWRIGEAWRLRLTTATGWRDDRIVRFTGNPQHPAAVVTRIFGRVTDRGGACDDLLTALAAA